MAIDGKQVNGRDEFRGQSPFFEFIIPATDNFLGVNDVTSRSSVPDGYWVMKRSSSPRMHVIHIEGALVSGPGAGTIQNVTYHLDVTPN